MNFFLIFFLAFMALPRSIYFVREKSYMLVSSYQVTAHGPLLSDQKAANRGGVTKERLKNYTTQDYSAMCNSKSIKEVSGLVSIKSKNFDVFLTTYRRNDSYPWSRKRRIYSNGTSTPFYFFLNDFMNNADEERIKRLKIV